MPTNWGTEDMGSRFPQLLPLKPTAGQPLPECIRNLQEAHLLPGKQENEHNPQHMQLALPANSSAGTTWWLCHQSSQQLLHNL